MTWNHRVVRTVYENGEVRFNVHEAHYDDPSDTVPHSITVDPVAPTGETVEVLQEECRRYAEACGKPVLEFVDGKVREWRGFVEWKPDEGE